MKDYVENKISLLSRHDLSSLIADFNDQLRDNDIGQTFYGKSFEDNDETLKKTGCIWVEDADGEFGDSDAICLKSSSRAPQTLENHIVWTVSKKYPEVVLLNEYGHCNGDFIGVRYKFVTNGKIITLEDYESTSETVVFDSEIDELRTENEDENYITWEDIHERHLEMFHKLREEFIEAHPERKDCIA